MAGSMRDFWNSAVGDAKKVLGSSVKIPNAKIEVALKRQDELTKTYNEFNSIRESLKKKLLELQDGESRTKNALVQAEDDMDDQDFGLDDSKPDDKKKLALAQTAFKKFFKDSEQAMENNIKNLDELDKHLMSLTKYKKS